MRRERLAAKLVRAGTAADRRRLLAENSVIADARLADALKDICYRTWMSEPVKARAAAAALNTLKRFRPDDSIEAAAEWAEGIAEITRGRMRAAVEHLDRAAEILRRTEREHDAAQAQVAKLLALAFLGEYDDALDAGMYALETFKTYRDQLSAGKVELNISNILARREKHRESEHFCRSALRRFTKLGERGWQAMAENSLANTFADRNKFARAEEFYGRALETARSAGMLVTEAEIEASLGNLALFRGDYDAALRFLELSRQKYESLGMPHQSAIAELEIADIYLELNLAADAVEIYRPLAAKFRRLRMPSEESRTRLNFGRAAASLGDLRSAKRELKRAEGLFRADKNRSGLASAIAARASLELQRGNAIEALAMAGKIVRMTAGGENVRAQLDARVLRGESAQAAGRTRHARKILDPLLKEASTRGYRDIELRSLNALGKIALETGDETAAEQYFSRATNLIELIRAPLAGEDFQLSFLKDKLEPFENLAQLYIRNGRLEDAFVALERSRSRALHDAMYRPKDIASADGGLTKKLAELREQLNWTYSRIRQSDGEPDGGLQARAEKLEHDIASVIKRIQSTQASGAGRSDIFTLPQLQEHLADRTLVEFVQLEGSYSAFAVSRGSIEFFGDLATNEEITQLLGSLHFQFGTLKYVGAAMARFESELKRRADAVLRSLYEKLLSPLERTITTRHVVIIPSGSLYHVPFHALRSESGYVIEQRKVSYSPGASIWAALQKKISRPVTKPLLIGYADESIPLVEKELAAVKSVFPASLVFSGRSATFGSYIENAPDHDLLHIACHGMFRPDNPLFSSLHLADGWVTARDITAQSLKAELVTLSACETGQTQVFAGDEILGLTRGFLSAGAGSLVASLWTVNDATTADLMSDFYSFVQQSADYAASLQKAQTKFIRQGKHPYYWSPFVLYGR